MIRLIVIACFVAYIVAVTGCAPGLHYVAMKPEGTTIARTEPPFENAVWVAPEYRWVNNTYVEEPAHWDKPQKSGVWVPGRWEQGKKGYTWVSGYWK